MSACINPSRRALLGTAAGGVAALQLAATLPAFGQSAGAASASGTAIAGRAPSTKLLDPVRSIDAGVLKAGYVDVDCMLAAAGDRVIVPHLRGDRTTRFRLSDTTRNGKQAVLAVGIIAFTDAPKIERSELLEARDGGRREACSRRWTRCAATETR